MKKLILLLIFFISCESIFTQVINDPSTYDSVTVIQNDDYFGIDRNRSESRTVSWGRMVITMNSELGSSILTDNNSFTGENSFTDKLIIPGSLLSSTTNGIGFSSGLFSWADGSTLYNGASTAWVLQTIADSGFAIDSNNYVTKAGNETITGSKIINNLFDIRDGTLYLPYSTSLNPSSGDQRIFVYSDGTVRVNTKDNINDKFNLTLASQAWVTSNFSQVTGFILSTGNQTNINSTLQRSSGGMYYYGTSYIDFGTDINSRFGFPNREGNTTQSLVNEGDVQWDRNSDRLEIYDGSNIHILQDADMVQGIVDETYSTNVPPIFTGAIDTIGFGAAYRNYIYKIFQVPQGGLTLFVDSTSYGVISFTVEGTQESVTFDWNGLTVKWAGSLAPTFDYASGTNKDHLISLKRKNATTVEGTYLWTQ